MYLSVYCIYIFILTYVKAQDTIIYMMTSQPLEWVSLRWRLNMYSQTHCTQAHTPIHTPTRKRDRGGSVWIHSMRR